MDDKKLNEIRTRKEEIRSLLESNDKELNLEELRSEIETLNKEEKEIEERMKIATQINNDEIVSKKIETNIKTNEVNKTMENKLESIEYRNAFMNYVCKGEQMPEEFRDVSLAAENQAVIPVPILNKIVEKIESFGNILPLVQKQHYQAGYSVPTSELTTGAVWMTEQQLATTGVTPGKKVTGSVVFAAYPLAKALSISYVAQLQTLSAFESALADNVAKAMAKSLEEAIINGNSVGQPTGLWLEAGTATNNVTLAASPKYKDIINLRKAIPAAYRDNAALVCNESLFWELVSITDNSGAPVARVNYGIENVPTYTILGLKVVPSEFCADYDTAVSGDIVGVIVQLDKYVLNIASEPDMRVYVDNPTRNRTYQSIMLADGKMVDKNGLVAVKKG